jgi:hypothetical protein
MLSENHNYIYTPGKRGRKSKYNSEEERKKARNAWRHEYYMKHHELLTKIQRDYAQKRRLLKKTSISPDSNSDVNISSESSEEITSNEGLE